MSIMRCNNCGYMADIDFDANNFIEDTCTDCVNEMSIDELIEFKDGLNKFDKQIISEIIEEKENGN